MPRDLPDARVANDVYSTTVFYFKLTQNPAAMEPSTSPTIRKGEGVWKVDRKEELSATDPLTPPVVLSHYEGRSGDLKMLGRAYWITSVSTTTPAPATRYDTARR